MRVFSHMSSSSIIIVNLRAGFLVKFSRARGTAKSYAMSGCGLGSADMQTDRQGYDIFDINTLGMQPDIMCNDPSHTNHFDHLHSIQNYT